MTTKALWAIIGLLGAACAGQGYYIYRLQEKEKKPAVEDFWKGQDKWFEEARKGLFGGAPVPFRKFDELFDDDFFGRRFDPFAEIEGFHKRFSPLLPKEERSLFGRSWRDWFDDRMGIAGISPDIKRTADKVVLSMRIPGLDGESLNVDVNEDRIRIVYDAKTVSDRKDQEGRSSFRSQYVRRFEKVMPIPEGADPKSSRVEKDGDTVKIIFNKAKEQDKA